MFSSILDYRNNISKLVQYCNPHKKLKLSEKGQRSLVIYLNLQSCKVPNSAMTIMKSNGRNVSTMSRNDIFYLMGDPVRQKAKNNFWVLFKNTSMNL